MLDEASADHLHMQQVPIAEIWSKQQPVMLAVVFAQQAGTILPARLRPNLGLSMLALSCAKPCAIPEQGQAQIRTSSGNHLINRLLLNKSKERRMSPGPEGASGAASPRACRKAIGTGPIRAGSMVIDRATKRLGVSRHSKSLCNVWSIQLFEKILPLFCRHLPVYIFNNADATLQGTGGSRHSLGPRQV